MKTPGQITYEAYVDHYPGVARDVALRLMPWEKLGTPVQEAWEAAARAGEEAPRVEGADIA